MAKRYITHAEAGHAAAVVALELVDFAEKHCKSLRAYAVPRGGVSAAYLIERSFAALCFQRTLPYSLILVHEPEMADVVLDDLVDSGKTRDRILPRARAHAQFFALFDKLKEGIDDWLIFPWEDTLEGSSEDIFVRLLQFIGEDPLRGGLVETPARMSKAWEFWTQGYKQDALAILKTFEDGGENYDEMIHVKDIPFYSQCEHHLAPFFGTITFAYIPDKRIVGLSKMNRLAGVFARRLQVQERLTVQIVDAFCDHVKPKGAAITVQARHLCMESRGICQQGVITTTSALRGVFKEQPAARAEFFSLSK